jgi:hypothetical protein
VTHALCAGNDAPVEPQSFGRVPFDDVAAAQDFQPGLIDRLALLQRHRGRHFVDALAHQLGSFQDDLRALGRRRLAPDGKSAFGGGQRIVEIGRGRGRNGRRRASSDHRCRVRFRGNSSERSRQGYQAAKSSIEH